MKVLAVISIIIAIGALVLVLTGGIGSLSIQSPPVKPVQPVVDGSSSIPDPPFGLGSLHQVRPTEVVVRVTRSGSDEIPPASHTIEIYNGRSTDATFIITWEDPYELWPGFKAPPTGSERWVTFSSSEITIPAKEVGAVQVTLNIPPKTVNYDWEFWVGVSEGRGALQTMICTRWLVEMR